MKTQTNSNIILTGTIDVSHSMGGLNTLVVSDIDERLHQYENAIERYIKESVFNKIVFVETSNFAFDTIRYEKMALNYNKHFEYLTFMGSYEEIKIKGKSLGDAEVINNALINSKILKNESTIYIVTGRLFLLNSKRS